MTLGSQEFLRRFLLHVLPRGFVRIRSFVSVSASTSLTNTSSAFLLTLSGPGGWGEGGQMTHTYVGEAGENSQ
jgi:hypothetical protein